MNLVHTRHTLPPVLVLPGQKVRYVRQLVHVSPIGKKALADRLGTELKDGAHQAPRLYQCKLYISLHSPIIGAEASFHNGQAIAEQERRSPLTRTLHHERRQLVQAYAASLLQSLQALLKCLVHT